MALPLYLLTAMVWFVLSFALPHSEAVTTGALVARTESVSHPPDMPTLEPQSWCQEVIPNGKGNVIWHTMTGPCTYNTLRGDVTLKGTEWVQIQPTATVPSGPSQSDSRCIFSKVKTQLGNGNAYWKPADDESAQKDCNDYCARIATQVGDGDKIKSATCFKNDNKPWVNKQGKQPSDDLPFGDRIYGVGECICDWPLLNDLVEDMVTKALPAIGEITCKTFYTAIDSVVAIGLNAIPGMAGVGAAGVRVAAQAAQVMSWTFSDPNEALEQYINWLQHPAGGDSLETDKEASTGPMDNICGNKYTPEGAEKIFNSFQFAANFASAPKLFAGAPKSWPPPFGQGSKNLDEARDFIKGLGKGKNNDDKDKPKPTQPKDTGVPATSPPAKTTNEPQSTQQTSDQRKQCKRDGDCTVVSYVVDQTIEGPMTTIEVPCNHVSHKQACAHYYSAIHARSVPAAFTCSKAHNKDGRINGDATKHWSDQHTNENWKAFTQPNVLNNKGIVTQLKCDADEFPPAYFMAQDKKMTQLVRWVPLHHNRGAGQLWAQFCDKHDGNAGNGQRVLVAQKNRPADENLIEFNTNNIKLENPDHKTSVGNDQKTTITSSWKKGTYTRAVFSMVFTYKNDETPSKKNNWHLEDNECWPKDIVPRDPGFALLKDDKWYDDNEGFGDAKDWRDLYASPPSAEVLEAANERNGNPKKHGADDSGDDQPPSQAPKKNPPRAVGAEKLELYEGRLIARDLETNTTRPLTNDEIRNQIEVVPCKDKHCADELQGRDIDANALLIPAVPPPSAPLVNHDAIATFAPTRSMRTEIRPQRRTSVIPDMPVVTG